MLRYRKLEIWQLAKDLAKDVYRVTDKYPEKERFCLVQQLNRAVVSIASNIAEGSSRISSKDQAHFIEIAFGSLMEVACQLEISEEFGYITKEALDMTLAKVKNLAVKMTNYRRTLLNNG